MQALTSFWTPFLVDLRALSDFGDGLSLYAIRAVRLASILGSRLAFSF